MRLPLRRQELARSRRRGRRVGLYVSASKLGFDLLIFVPLFGDLSIQGLVHDLTRHVEKQDGDNVRMVHGTSENYWYGFSPFTWVITPVVSTSAAEYRPSPEAVARDHETEQTKTVARWYKPWTW